MRTYSVRQIAIFMRMLADDINVKISKCKDPTIHIDEADHGSPYISITVSTDGKADQDSDMYEVSFRRRDDNRIKVAAILDYKASKELELPAKYDDCNGNEFTRLLMSLYDGSYPPED